jgi:hypothetical protein
MTESLRIRQARKFYGLIVTSFLVLTVFLFWLALSANNLVGLLPAAFAIVFAWMASILIRRPFALELSADGLLIETPFGDSFFDWSGFQGFAIKYADPFTKHIVFKLKPEVDVPRLYRVLRSADYDVGLFPYFDIGNDELLRLMRQYRYRSIQYLGL